MSDADDDPWTPIGEVLSDPSRLVARRAHAAEEGTYGPGKRIDLHSRTGGDTLIPFTAEEMSEMQAKMVTTWNGTRAWVFPIHFMHGQPVYPRYDLEPGDKRRAAEAGLMEEYRKYREEKKRRGPAKQAYEPRRTD